MIAMFGSEATGIARVRSQIAAFDVRQRRFLRGVSRFAEHWHPYLRAMDTATRYVEDDPAPLEWTPLIGFRAKRGVFDGEQEAASFP